MANPAPPARAHLRSDVDSPSVAFFKRDWLAVTSNIWSHSGINQGVDVQAELTNAYSANQDSILGWTRQLGFQGDVLRIQDACSVAPDVQPIFQLHVPSQPVMQSDGSIQAGGLRIVLHQSVNVNVVSMASVDPDFTKGTRIDLTVTSGCAFDVELQAL